MLPQEDVQVLAAVRRYVMPGRPYAKLHGWNLKHRPAPDAHALAAELAARGAVIGDHELVCLFHGEWRARLTGAWLVALGGRTAFRELLGELLTRHGGGKDARGYVLALASFGTEEDAALLRCYAARTPDSDQHRFSRDWALGALRLLSGRPDLPPAPEDELVAFLADLITSHVRPAPAGAESPAERFRAWRPTVLPEAWRVVTPESARRALDARAVALAAMEPLAVAVAGAGEVVLCRLRSPTHPWATVISSGGCHEYRLFTTVSEALRSGATGDVSA
ncbi:hypothetical protein GCM10009801_72720 [Streptomyces albiaxialis]|uniref:Uncharacterized protein n=1 Tax=Streptomyces albiaxialis TaxID=329523 RepID=A0ABN2WXH0_9ACTN